jgi:DNA-binding transcriptional regulator YdaS (Cro superfamily)
MSAIKEAVRLAGGPTALAKKINVKTPTVCQWLSKKRPVPSGRCLAIEQAVDGRVTRYELCPEVFGQPAEPLPVSTSATEAA